MQRQRDCWIKSLFNANFGHEIDKLILRFGAQVAPSQKSAQAISEKTRRVTDSETLHIELAPAGGFVGVFSASGQ
jgi:hypothetical protein